LLHSNIHYISRFSFCFALVCLLSFICFICFVCLVLFAWFCLFYLFCFFFSVLLFVSFRLFWLPFIITLLNTIQLFRLNSFWKLSAIVSFKKPIQSPLSNWIYRLLFILVNQLALFKKAFIVFDNVTRDYYFILMLYCKIVIINNYYIIWYFCNFDLFESWSLLSLTMILNQLTPIDASLFENYILFQLQSGKFSN
jgi:hypothetical protein